MTLDYFYGQAGELFSFFRIPKALFQEQRFQNLSTDAKILYGILLDRMSLSAKNGWRDEQGRVYIIYTVREVQKSLCCAEHKAVKLLRELEDIDLVERKRRGLGRPSLIYVKDFSSGLPKAQVQNCPNSNSGAAESAILEQPKPQANKTNLVIPFVLDAIITFMQALGVDIQTIQSIVGHADTEMTEHYLHVQESIRQSAIQLFSEAFSA